MNTISTEKLKTGLKTKFIGQEIKHYESIPSTNAEGRRLAEEGVDEGTVVISEEQTQGRGRRGRAWSSPKGGIWLTIILRPKIPPSYAPVITLLTGIVCAKTIEKVTKLKPTLKWPNDVHIKGKKVCGILTELSSEPDMVKYALVGLGINANNKISDFPKELQAQVTTLITELKQPINRVDFFQNLLMEFERLYIPFTKDPIVNIPKIIKSWCGISDTIGRDVKIETITGTIAGFATEISEDGSLIVVTKSGEKERIIAGDCIYLDQDNE